jgi:hypothetical protein
MSISLKNSITVSITGRDLRNMPQNTVRDFVPGDGDCLFHAFKAGYGLPNETSVKSLREKVVKVMRSHKRLFAGIMSRTLGAEVDFDNYLLGVSGREYADDLCITALAIAYNCNINIFRQSIGSPNVSVWEFQALGIDCEPVNIWNLVKNSQGDHYDSIQFGEGVIMVLFVD